MFLIEKIDNRYLNEEKNALEVFLLFQLRLPAFQESSTHVQMELTAEFCSKFVDPKILIKSPETVRLGQISVPQTNGCIEWELP